jgi:ParB family transcriptional regulator, chromosome partitioning protein
MAREIVSIPISDLTVLQSQVRTRDAGNGIDELAGSLQRQGLLEPIIIAPTDQPGKYQVIAGQRRLLAARKLGWTEIEAVIQDLTGVQDVETKIKEISATENIVRSNLKLQDQVDVMEHFFYKYGTMKAVHEETGIPMSQIRPYIRMARLRSDLKPLVIERQYDVETVLAAQDIATNPDTQAVNIEQAIKVAEALHPLDKAGRKVAVAAAEENPEITLAQMVDAATSAPKIERVTVTFDQKSYRALTSFAKDNDSPYTKQDVGQLVHQMITDHLVGEGYLSD